MFGYVVLSIMKTVMAKYYNFKEWYSWNINGIKLTSQKNYYTLFYNVYHGSQSYSYKIAFPKKRGPCNIKRVSNDQGEDVTDEIKEYLGPGHNFYGIQTCPGMLGYNFLKIEYYNGNIVDYLDHEDIRII